MPVKIPASLPARDVLEAENVFLIEESRALHQDIRPLRIAILNLMPTKVATETQLLRLLGNTPLQVEVTLLRVNEGTTLVLDGQANVPLRAGDRVSIARHHTAARFIGNPGNTYWRTLVEKMRWAAPPAYRE